MYEIKHHAVKELCSGQAKLLLLEHYQNMPHFLDYVSIHVFSFSFFLFLDGQGQKKWLQPWKSICLKLSTISGSKIDIHLQIQYVTDVFGMYYPVSSESCSMKFFHALANSTFSWKLSTTARIMAQSPLDPWAPWGIHDPADISRPLHWELLSTHALQLFALPRLCGFPPAILQLWYFENSQLHSFLQKISGSNQSWRSYLVQPLAVEGMHGWS